MLKLYADGASLEEMIFLNSDERVQGFTTNPSLMKSAGVKNYERFAREILKNIKEKPVSFEVIGDGYEEMKRQAIRLSQWGENVYVKIPVTDTVGNTNYALMRVLSLSEIKINATAITTMEQIDEVIKALDTETPSIISIFAGRIADTGVSPAGYIKYAHYRKKYKQEILWASTREVLNLLEANEAKADIITVTIPIYKKIFSQWGKPLSVVSLETVRQFYNDAKESGLTL